VLGTDTLIMLPRLLHRSSRTNTLRGILGFLKKTIALITENTISLTLSP
jgi:hypothetical protein